MISRKMLAEQQRAATAQKAHPGEHVWTLYIQARYIGVQDANVETIITLSNAKIIDRRAYAPLGISQLKIQIEDKYMERLYAYYNLLSISQEKHQQPPSARLPDSLHPPKLR